MDLRSGGDPPQNSAQNSPATRFVQYNKIEFSILRFENIQDVIAAQARNPHPSFVVCDDHNLAEKLAALCLKSIDTEKIPLSNQRFHRPAFDPEQARIRRIRTPRGRYAHFFRSGNRVKAAAPVAGNSVASDGRFQ